MMYIYTHTHISIYTHRYICIYMYVYHMCIHISSIELKDMVLLIHNVVNMVVCFLTNLCGFFYLNQLPVCCCNPSVQYVTRPKSVSFSGTLKSLMGDVLCKYCGTYSIVVLFNITFHIQIPPDLVGGCPTRLLCSALL